MPNNTVREHIRRRCQQMVRNLDKAQRHLLIIHELYGVDNPKQQRVIGEFSVLITALQEQIERFRSEMT